jgi:hypothetical protein
MIPIEVDADVIADAHATLCWVKWYFDTLMVEGIDAAETALIDQQNAEARKCCEDGLDELIEKLGKTL